jgi:hypothetical protein
MRKLILISALVLASATAQASPSRGLVLASNDEPAAAAPVSNDQAPAKESAPAYVARPSAVEAKADQPKAEPAKIETSKPEAVKAEAVKAEKPRRRHASTEARVIYELHRHGIYW